MKTITYHSLSLFVAGLLSCATAFASNNNGTPVGGKLTKFAEKHQHKGLTMPNIFLSGKNSKVSPSAPSADNNPVATMSTTGKWGLLEGEDGSTWYYTITYTEAEGFYTGASIKVFNDVHEQVGTINVSVPEGKRINDITPFGTITSKMFDKNDKTQELTVSLHAVGDASNNYHGTYYTYAYQLDGTLVQTYVGSGVLVNFAQNAWTKYTRLLLVNDTTEVLTDSLDQYGDPASVDYETITVMRPASWGEDAPVAEHTFKFDLNYTYYSNGSPINIFEVDGEPYYTLAMYAKPFVSGYDLTTYEPFYSPDNSYVIRSFDKRYNLVDSIAIPLDTLPDGNIRMAEFGSFSKNNLTKNFFTTDGQLDYVVTFNDYIISKDADCFTFNVYHNDGTHVKTICDNVYNTWFDLADINGQSSQMAFMQEIGTAQQMQMVDIPSCEKKTLLPADINGVTISTDLNRYPKGNSYQYVVKMLNGIEDDNNNTIARIGWYNPDLSFDHYTSFNLGPNGENFRINLNDNVLNPYLFNTDDSLEYCYIAKVKRDDSNKIDNILVIADHEGNTIRKFAPDETKGALYSASVLTDDAENTELMVIYTNSETGATSFDFYSLPFTKFTAGGDGTVANPYLISTVGDLLQVSKAPTANYKLAANLDMSTYDGLWTPIKNFSGYLEGDNHVISNLDINSTASEVGLFGALMQGAKIRNLAFANPTINVNSNSQYVGVLAGTCSSDTIQNIHVYDGQIVDPSQDAWATVGGIIGQGALYTQIESSSYDGSINVSGCSPVGGIAGDTQSSSNVLGSTAKGQFTAGNSLGGIVGSTATDTKVIDCYSNTVLTASNTVGGIVGDNGGRGLVDRCYAIGDITATEASWNGISAGGIIGSLASNWSNASDTVVSNCIATGNISVPTTEPGADPDNTAHRIVGRTIANEYYEEGETPMTEAGLVNNYAANNITVGGNVVTSSDEKSTEGADIAIDALTTDFFASLGYSLGNTITNPWKATGAMPVLYFEQTAFNLVLDKETLTLHVGESAPLVATVYGTDIDDVDVNATDNDVVNIEMPTQDAHRLAMNIIAMKEGTSTITLSSGNLTATCVVTVVPADAIGSISTTGKKISIEAGNGYVHADGASHVAIFSANGQAVAKANGENISVASLTKGVYVVLAKDNKGNTASAKVVIK